MSAQLLMEAVAKVLAEKTRGIEQSALDLRYQPATIQQETLVPAATAEDLGLRILELNAVRRAYRDAAQVLKDEYLRLVDPAAFDAAQKQPGEGEKVEPVY